MSIAQFKIRFKVPNISELKDTFLPEFTVQRILWKVKIVKDKDGHLGLYLHCPKGDNTEDWSVTARWSFQILTSKLLTNYEKNVDPFVFDSSNISWGFSSLIKWTTLCDKDNGYVENDMIHLDVTIESVNPNDANESRLVFRNSYKSCEENCHAVFLLIIENVERLMAVRSPLFNERSMPWKLTVFKRHQGILSVRLRSKLNTPDKIVRIRLVPWDDSSNSNTKFETKYIRPSCNYQTETLISWTELMKPENGFIKNNSIMVSAEVMDDGINALIRESKSLPRLECPVCFENIQDKDISSVVCGHQFCTPCIRQYVEDRGECPSCQKPAVVNDLRRMYLPM